MTEVMSQCGSGEVVWLWSMWCCCGQVSCGVGDLDFRNGPMNHTVSHREELTENTLKYIYNNYNNTLEPSVCVTRAFSIPADTMNKTSPKHITSSQCVILKKQGHVSVCDTQWMSHITVTHVCSCMGKS